MTLLGLRCPVPTSPCVWGMLPRRRPIPWGGHSQPTGSVGCEAPEIVAKDIQGVEFKLSDYRGKVVLLDFWGFW